MTQDPVLSSLLELSHWLGDPARDLAMLGEGNTSAAVGDGTLWVKASGSSLQTLREPQLVRVQAAPLLALLDGTAPVSDNDAKAALEACRLDSSAPMPSVETFFHALLLGLDGVRFVGHTHPVSVNGILCSRDGWPLVQEGRLFPDEIVVCGPAPCFVAYTDPGVVLSRAIGAAVSDFQQEHGIRPKAILLQNQGFIALGATANEVQAITAMWDKTARILTNTMSFGGPRTLTNAQVRRIYTRPDEHLRQRALGLTADTAPAVSENGPSLENTHA